MIKPDIYIAFLSFSLLAACGSDGFTATPVSVTAQSGGKVELTGTWKSACYPEGSDYLIDVRVYTSNGRLTISTDNYGTDSACATLVSTVTHATEARVSVGSDVTASGWRDGAGNADSAPGSLSTTPTVTQFTLTLDDSSTMKSINLIDDSTSSWVLYRADTNEVDTDDYYNYLSTATPLNKQ